MNDMGGKMAPKSLLEYVDDAHRVADANGGVLPTRNQLRKRRLTWLEWHIRKYPEAFDHIPQEKRDNNGNLVGLATATNKILFDSKGKRIYSNNW